MTNTDTPQPECWCSYGGEGREAEHPQCPEHTGYVPPADTSEPVECEICSSDYDLHTCSHCDGDGDDGQGFSCWHCGGRGEVVPDHCCACGGSPYCQCCSKCGNGYAGSCGCPIPLQLQDGTTLVL